MVGGPTGGRRYLPRTVVCRAVATPPRRGKRRGPSGDLACRCQAVDMLGAEVVDQVSLRAGSRQYGLHAGPEQAELPLGILAGGWRGARAKHE